MKTRNKVLIVFVVITIAAMLSVAGYLFYQYRQFEQKLFLDHSTLNGLDVSCMSVDGAYDVVYADSKNKKITLTAQNQNLLDLELSNFCEITFDKEAIQRGMDEITFKDFLQGKSRNYQTDCNVEMNKEKASIYLKEKLSTIQQKKPKDARIKKTEDGFELVSGVEGTKIARKRLLNYIWTEIEEIAKNQITSIDVTEFYKKPLVKAEDLEADFEKLEKYLNWKVSYQGCKVTIDREDLFPYIKYQNKKKKIVIDNSFLRNKTSELAQALNTVGSTRKFKVTSYKEETKKAHSGEEILVSGGTYGQIVNTEEEYNVLSELLKECKSKKKKEPVWQRETQSSKKDDDIGDTYIEISIDRQHLWYYVEGKLEMETDIVTGMKGTHDTPTGTYYITERINGKYLIGDTYKTWVDKWMRLTNMGVGLHDASWKSRFGGSIYTYSGSHGCINLPSSFAYELFDRVYVGLPVIIYDLG